jgi:rare lipoprotein A
LRSLPRGRARPRHAAIGALALAGSLSVTALALAETTGEPVVRSRPPAPRLEDARVRFEQPVVVRGRLAAAAAGSRVALQHAPRPGRRWRTVATAAVRSDGRYRLTARLRRSGGLRVVPLAVGDATGLVAGGAVVATVATPSRPFRIVVGARLAALRRDSDVQAGAAVRVRGTLIPRQAGRRVLVEGGAAGRWRVLARTVTRADGRFAARVSAPDQGTLRLRVRFAGDRRNAGTTAGAGTLQVFRPAVASWYALYGNRTACGQTLGYETLGVAHRWLPCGTKVTFRYGGREVTVPVIDRGPFAHGREWDLTGATARRLGFGGVATVWSTR